MGLFSFLTTLISTVYPVIASYKAFDNYLEISKKIDNSSIRVAGITVPLPLTYLLSKSTTTTTTNGNTVTSTTTSGSSSLQVNEEHLQSTLITIHKWFIYWIVFGTIQLTESFLFFTWIIPFYSYLKLGFFIWLVVPMIKSSFDKRQRQLLSGKDFTLNDDWIKFTESGAGFVFFTYIQPLLGSQFDNLGKLADKSVIHYILDSNPSLNASSTSSGGAGTSGVSGIGNASGESSESATATSSGQDSIGNVIDSSYVMVMNIKNRFGYGNDTSNVEESNVVSETTSETNDSTDTSTSINENRKEKKKGWFW
ncbi:uncharacterized protein RJT21DRAFT_117370 [Scheffersomyces amazonensis]|uniref:uncharacterized protein n=1 Tax=Scheffersomyces amazonensis TaxID=1078765 RepID=UPI00315D6D16